MICSDNENLAWLAILQPSGGGMPRSVFLLFSKEVCAKTAAMFVPTESCVGCPWHFAHAWSAFTGLGVLSSPIVADCRLAVWVQNAYTAKQQSTTIDLAGHQVL